MRAVIAPEPGGPEALSHRPRPTPSPRPGEVVIDVAAHRGEPGRPAAAAGLLPAAARRLRRARPRVLRRVSAVGADVEGWSVGDEVCALLAGGGYAEKVAVPAGQVMPVPDGVDLVTAGALPEVACTVWSNVFMIAGLQPDETLLVHGGAGGIGTMAIQLANALGARVLTTAGSAEKIEVCRSLGADVAINYREQDFVEEVRAATDGRAPTSSSTSWARST